MIDLSSGGGDDRAERCPSVVIRGLGARGEGESIEVPTDWHATGWWTDGSEPEERGPAVILGHVDSHVGPAVFARLHELGPATASSSSDKTPPRTGVGTATV